jgi:hypothetical protein
MDSVMSKVRTYAGAGMADGAKSALSQTALWQRSVLCSFQKKHSIFVGFALAMISLQQATSIVCTALGPAVWEAVALLAYIHAKHSALCHRAGPVAYLSRAGL